MWLILNFLFLSILGLNAHDSRYDNVRSSQEPIVLITKEKLQTLESDTRLDTRSEKQEPRGPQEKIQGYESALDQYYSQFVEEKKTDLDRKRSGEFYNLPEKEEVSFYFKNHSGQANIYSDVNSIRLLASQFRSGFVQSGLVRDSEVLYTLHSRLAVLYDEENMPHKAMEHYLAAFRYRNFANTEENYREESAFREILDDSDISKLKSHSDKYKELLKFKKDILDSEDELHLIQAEMARSNKDSVGTIPDFSEQKKRIESNKEELKKKEEEYEKSAKENFLPYQEKRGEIDASLLLKFAILSRKLELEDRLRNKFRKSSFPLVDAKRETNFSPYANILELAHRLSPSNPEVLKRLGEEYKNSGKRKESLGYYLKFVRLPEEKIQNKKDLKDAFYSIAALYSDENYNVNAFGFYNRYLSMVDDPKEKEPILYQLGDFSIRRLGDLESSSEFFQKWLELVESKKEDKDRSEEFFVPISKKFIANYSISKYKRFIKKPEEEDIFLKNCFSLYKEMETQILSKKEEVSKGKQSLLEIKKVLLQNSSEQDLQVYQDEQKKLQDSEQKLNQLEISFKSIPRVEFLLRLAHVSEDKRDYSKSKTYYRELMKIGSESERNLGLRNIMRIDKILSDGVYREKILQ